MYNPVDVKRVRDEADMLQIISNMGIKVTKKGRFCYVPCPFHSDWAGDGGSCSLTPGRNIFHCFACNESGNIFKLYIQLKGMSQVGGFNNAVKQIHESSGMNFPLRVIGKTQRTILQKLNGWLTSFKKIDDLEIQKVDGGKISIPSWAINNRTELESIPEDIRRCFIRTADETPIKYPLVFRFIDATDCVLLEEQDTHKMIGVFVPDMSHANFIISKGIAKKLNGKTINNKVATVDMPTIFHTKFAVENPLDYLIISEYKFPCYWGIWDANGLNPRFESPKYSIPCVIQLHIGNHSTCRRRFTEVALSASEYWLPREYAIADCNSLLDKNCKELLSDLFRTSGTI